METVRARRVIEGRNSPRCAARTKERTYRSSTCGAQWSLGAAPLSAPTRVDPTAATMSALSAPWRSTAAAPSRDERGRSDSAATAPVHSDRTPEGSSRSSDPVSGGRNSRASIFPTTVGLASTLVAMSTSAWVKAYSVAIVSLISGASAMHWVLKPDIVRAPPASLAISFGPCRLLCSRWTCELFSRDWTTLSPAASECLAEATSRSPQTLVSTSAEPCRQKPGGYCRFGSCRLSWTGVLLLPLEGLLLVLDWGWC